ncbi:unnamed protein product [Lathyrus oleraceus]
MPVNPHKHRRTSNNSNRSPPASREHPHSSYVPPNPSLAGEHDRHAFNNPLRPRRALSSKPTPPRPIPHGFLFLFLFCTNSNGPNKLLRFGTLYDNHHTSRIYSPHAVGVLLGSGRKYR